MDSRHYRWVVFIAVFLLASIYFFVFSKSGLLERINLENEKKSLIANIEELKAENSRLKKLLDKYRKGRYPGDDLLKSGYIRPGEKVVYLRGLKERRKSGDRVSAPVTGLPLVLPYLRIGWLALSAIILVLMILYARKNREELKT
ncbi:MAG: septum formation initiator family protein [Spirochaetes bacterium]|nr:septum formation initiator family protein [Spirochaetota bacterium]